MAQFPRICLVLRLGKDLYIRLKGILQVLARDGQIGGALQPVAGWHTLRSVGRASVGVRILLPPTVF